MEKRWTKLASSLLPTALPHLFTHYPHYAVTRDSSNKAPAAQQQDLYKNTPANIIVAKPAKVIDARHTSQIAAKKVFIKYKV